MGRNCPYLGVAILSLTLLLVISFTSPAVHASQVSYQDNVLYVDNNYENSQKIPNELSQEENAFASIENAVNKADPVENNTIKVFAGIYNNSLENFPITVNVKDLTIIAENGPNETFIDVNDPSWGSYGFELITDNITLAGFTVTDAHNGFYLDGSSNNLLENNLAENNKGGFYLNNSSENNVLENNLAKNNDNIGFGLWTSDNNTLKNNQAENNKHGGFELFSSSKNNTLENNLARNNYIGFGIFYSSDNNTLENNFSQKDEYGLALGESSFNHLLKNFFRNNLYGIYFRKCDNNILSANTVKNNEKQGIYLENSDYNNLTANLLRYNDGGILLENSSNNTIENNIIENVEFGGTGTVVETESLENEDNTSTSSPSYPWAIFILRSERNEILNNKTENAVQSIMVKRSDNNLIRGNLIENADAGSSTFFAEDVFRYPTVHLINSSNNEFSSNEIINNVTGIRVEKSDNTLMKNNIIENNKVDNSEFMEIGSGIILDNSQKVQMENNNLSNNAFNLYVRGKYDHKIDNTNTVNGKPVLYLKNKSSITLNQENEIGFLGVVSSENLLIENLALKNNGTGLLLANSENIVVKDVKLTKNWLGLKMDNLSYSSLQESRIWNNAICGLYINDSYKVDVCDTVVDTNYYAEQGVSLYNSSYLLLDNNRIDRSGWSGLRISSVLNSTFVRNWIENHTGYGIYVDNSSDNNVFFHNFIHSNQKSNAVDKGSNRWENLALGEGNWWGDWQAPDNTSDPNNDGVLDNQYLFKSNQDNHPLALVTLQSPSDESTLSDSTPTLRWSSPVLSDYQVHISESSSLPPPPPEDSTWIQDNHYTTSSLSDGTYYWRVIGKVENSYMTPWTSAWSFTISTGGGGGGGGGNDSPTADFTYSPSSPATGDTINFSDQSSDPDGSVETWSWDFDDGASSSKQNPSHSYDDSGDYTVSLTVTDDNGATDSMSKEITVSPPANEPPTADFTYSPSSPTPGDNVKFDGTSSSDDDGTVENYEWDLDGDGQYDDALDAKPTRTFDSVDNFNVGLRITDNGGATDTIIKTVEITAIAPPKANFVHKPTKSVLYQPVEFDASISKAGDNPIDSYRWKFGDGENDSGKIVTHAYEKRDKYQVTLTVVDTQGLSDSKTKPVTIHKLPENKVGNESSYENVSIEKNESENLETKNVDVTQVSITVTRKVENASVKIQEMENTPQGVETSAPGIDYKMFNFETENFSDESIKNVEMDFRVKKDWLNSKNVDESSIKLYRFKLNDDEWEELDTKRVSEDEKYVYYSTASSSFSLYAVSGQSKGAMPGGLPWLLIAGVVGILIVFIAAGYGTMKSSSEDKKTGLRKKGKSGQLKNENPETNRNRMRLVEKFLSLDRKVAKVSGDISAEEMYSSIQEAVKRSGVKDRVEVLVKDGNVHLKKK